MPGDLLYGIDIALEAFGIGDGSIDERIQESDILVAAGDHERAFVLLGQTLEDAEASGDSEGAQQTQERIVVVASASNGGHLYFEMEFQPASLQRFS